MIASVASGRILRSRLAPSPTGAQHLGNARTFVICWLYTRCHEGELLLRIEDLDTPRTKSWANQQAIDDLKWLGIDWDATAPLQSLRNSDYQEVLDALKQKQQVYPCTCSRSQIEACSSAPHESYLDGVVYSGQCTDRSAQDSERLDAQGLRYAWRFRMPQSLMTWHDELLGPQSLDAKRLLGDFIIARNYGPAAYQLAVTVDDHEQGITLVLRGDDLVYSTYRQLAIYSAMNWPSPSWMHVPLVVGPDGKRLAKRHGDTRLAEFRAQGFKPQQILGSIAQSLSLTNSDAPLSASDLLSIAKESPYWWEKIPKDPWVFDSPGLIPPN
ncbi:MAG: tRNA glutamyl-Q(34) synthetase GluQRS [Planctomycetota bacterium]